MINEWMSKIFGVSWKTSLFGWIAAICAANEITEIVPEGDLKAKVHAFCLLLVAFGIINAKDSNVTNAKQPVEPKKVPAEVQAGFGT